MGGKVATVALLSTALAAALIGCSTVGAVGASRASSVTHRSPRTGGLGARVVNLRVAIDSHRVLGVVSDTAIGVNDAVWDPYLLDPRLPALLRRVGVSVMRFPGGSIADIYHWQTHTLTPGAQWHVDPQDTFNAFMSVVKKVGAQAMITVNYGSNKAGTRGGSPAAAAAWVRYADRVKGDGVIYWEVGNEVYGDGIYGSKWEENLHRNKGPEAYAKNFLAFAKAMKAADKSIRIGAVLTVPGLWPSGQLPHWNRTVLSIAGKAIDFVDIHWYPQNPASAGVGSESDQGLLAAPKAIPAMMRKLRAEIAHYCGSHAKDVQVMLTETNSVSSNPGKQTASLVNALFLANDYMTWLQNGVANVDWWDVHNGIVTGQNNSRSLYGTARYGDYGLLSNGSSSGGISEPPAETPFPSYYGLQMVHLLAQPGDRMIAAVAPNPSLAVHAVLQRNGHLAVMIINNNRSSSYHVSIPASGVVGRTASTRGRLYFYGEGSKTVTSRSAGAHGSTFDVYAPPYSIQVLIE